MNRTLFKRTRLLRYQGAGLMAIALLQPGAGYGQTVELLNPGARTTLPVDSAQSDCATNQIGDASNIVGIPIVTCSDNPTADIQLQVLAASAGSARLQLPPSGPGNPVIWTSIQNHDSSARLFRDIRIPVPEEEYFSSTLRLQVATEAAWSGGFVVGGAPSTYAQITATLQLRDVTDSETGPVIASDTFFVERFDSVFDLELPTSVLDLADLLNQVDAIDVSNSSGSDITALVQRGRTYRIELEAKCDVGAPVFGFAFCLFAGDTAAAGLGLEQGNPLSAVFANDGFQVAPFEVTVDSDPIEAAVSQL
jgi:hypothetical protein